MLMLPFCWLLSSCLAGRFSHLKTTCRKYFDSELLPHKSSFFGEMLLVGLSVILLLVWMTHILEVYPAWEKTYRKPECNLVLSQQLWVKVVLFTDKQTRVWTLGGDILLEWIRPSLQLTDGSKTDTHLFWLVAFEKEKVSQNYSCSDFCLFVQLSPRLRTRR